MNRARRRRAGLCFCAAWPPAWKDLRQHLCLRRFRDARGRRGKKKKGEKEKIPGTIAARCAMNGSLRGGPRTLCLFAAGGRSKGQGGKKKKGEKRGGKGKRGDISLAIYSSRLRSPFVSPP